MKHKLNTVLFPFTGLPKWCRISSVGGCSQALARRIIIGGWPSLNMLFEAQVGNFIVKTDGAKSTAGSHKSIFEVRPGRSHIRKHFGVRMRSDTAEINVMYG